MKTLLSQLVRDTHSCVSQFKCNCPPLMNVCFPQGGPGIRGARGDRGEPGPVVSCCFWRSVLSSSCSEKWFEWQTTRVPTKQEVMRIFLMSGYNWYHGVPSYVYWQVTPASTYPQVALKFSTYQIRQQILCSLPHIYIVSAEISLFISMSFSPRWSGKFTDSRSLLCEYQSYSAGTHGSPAVHTHTITHTHTHKEKQR